LFARVNIFVSLLNIENQGTYFNERKHRKNSGKFQVPFVVFTSFFVAPQNIFCNLKLHNTTYNLIQLFNSNRISS